MGIIMHKSLELKNAVLIAAWPGIGNVGMLAVDSLRRQLKAEKVAELEPGEFFFPWRVNVQIGVIQGLAYPRCDFHCYRSERQDILFFLGESQPESGWDAHVLAGQVLEAARCFGCRRVYTAAAAVSPIHHEMEPRVRVVATSEAIVQELARFNIIPGIGENDPAGAIYGLNGLLLGEAQKQGWEAACLLGEVPDYLANVPFVLPHPARSVFTVFQEVLGLAGLTWPLEEAIEQMDSTIAQIYQILPLEIKDKLEQRKQASPETAGEISKEESDWLKSHIGELFRPTP